VGDIVYGALPGPSQYFIAPESARTFLLSNGGAVDYHHFTQSGINPRFGPRNSLQAYIVVRPDAAAIGFARNNASRVIGDQRVFLGNGNAEQIFVVDPTLTLRPLGDGGSWPLNYQYRIPFLPEAANE
jgi:hypothetical protein